MQETTTKHTLRSLTASMMVFVFPVPGGYEKVDLVRLKAPKYVLENLPPG